MTDAVAVEVGIGEALVRQSSGRHRAQGVVGLGVSGPVHGMWGIAGEIVGTTVAEESPEISLRQSLLRPALVGTLTFEHKKTAFELGLGPAVALTITHWGEPELGDALLVEPGARARLALAMGIGEHLRIRLQGGLGWCVSGVDHDYQVGAAWAF